MKHGFRPRLTEPIAGVCTGAYDGYWDDRDEDDYYGDPEDRECWQCGGEGWGIVGTSWDSDDPINGPYDGEIERCPCCHGSGLAKDCTYW